MNKKFRGKTLLVLEPTFGFNKVAEEYGFTTILGRQLERDETLTDKIDAVVFMGGTDISPSIYGQSLSQYSQRPDVYRDEREIALYRRFLHKPKLGVCRGAQLINCLNGGTLFHHVYGHTSGNHPVIDNDGKEHLVCSVHHQMMRLPETGELVSWRESGKDQTRFDGEGFVPSDGVDPEVVFFSKTPDKGAELCFQAHPEFGPDACTDYFFNLVSERVF